MLQYSKDPISVIQLGNKPISVFAINGDNLEEDVVHAFGEEWSKFSNFTEEMIESFAVDYFDIVTEDMVNSNTHMMDVGCGTGRWSKYFSSRAGFIDAVDPSIAIYSAEQLLGDIQNIRLTKASIDTLPFADESFDFIMCVGVLHHTPNPAEAMKKCVAKLKKGGFFYCYLYHNLEAKSLFSRLLFNAGERVRKIISFLPKKLKQLSCDIIAVVIYMPFILLTRLLNWIGLQKLALRIPLSVYHDKSFFIVRNDSLDKFGTKLEYRYSKLEITKMLTDSGICGLIFSEKKPYYHVVGQKL
jgi:SAM-dependent methyltransferase